MIEPIENVIVTVQGWYSRMSLVAEQLYVMI